MNHRNLTPQEIAQLQSQGNRAEDWSRVVVADPICLDSIHNNQFYGSVLLGPIAQECIQRGDLVLPQGISDSRLRDCHIGAHCAIHGVKMLAGYTIGHDTLLFNIDEMTASDHYHWLEPMNENGGRRILPFSGMTIGDAYLWARFRGQSKLMERLEQFTNAELRTPQGTYAQVGDHCTIKNTKSLHNVAVRSQADDPTAIIDCIHLADGVVGLGCTLDYGIIAERFLLGEHVHLEFGLRLNDTVVGDNSTLARCEVGNSIIFPAHEQHHNNSFLIAALIMGQSNIAAGGTLGSNHNSRTADNELSCGRGFWPGLCVSLKHSSRFASNCLLAKGDYPNELNITLPFALVNNNVAADRLEVMPAYWWMYNMYAMDRNSRKFAQRDKRHAKAQHIEFDNLAPDTAEEIIIARDLLHLWTEEAYREQRPFITAHGMEKSRRPTVILKAGEGYKAYYDMLVYYAMKALGADPAQATLPQPPQADAPRETRWVNLGGQLIAEADLQQLIADIEEGNLDGWQAIHQRLDQLWQHYPQQKQQHAYQVLCHLAQKRTLDADDQRQFLADYRRILQYVDDQKVLSRKKDDQNQFRNMTYWNDAERNAVLQ